MTRHLYPLHCLFPPAKAPMLYPCHPNTLPLSPIHLLLLQYHVRFQFVVFSHAVIFYSCDELSLGHLHLKPNNFSNSLWLSKYCLIQRSVSSSLLPSQVLSVSISDLTALSHTSSFRPSYSFIFLLILFQLLLLLQRVMRKSFIK